MAFLPIDAIRGMQQSYQHFMWFSAIRGFKVTLPRAAGPAETFVAPHRGNNWREISGGLFSPATRCRHHTCSSAAA